MTTALYVLGYLAACYLVYWAAAYTTMRLDPPPDFVRGIIRSGLWVAWFPVVPMLMAMLALGTFVDCAGSSGRFSRFCDRIGL